MVGTFDKPTSLAASTRPCPAMMLFSLSIRTGWVNPNSLMLAAIWRICRLECVRAFRAYGRSASTGKYVSESPGVPLVVGEASVEFFIDGMFSQPDYDCDILRMCENMYYVLTIIPGEKIGRSCQRSAAMNPIRGLQNSRFMRLWRP